MFNTNQPITMRPVPRTPSNVMPSFPSKPTSCTAAAQVDGALTAAKAAAPCTAAATGQRAPDRPATLCTIPAMPTPECLGVFQCSYTVAVICTQQCCKAEYGRQTLWSTRSKLLVNSQDGCSSTMHVALYTLLVHSQHQATNKWQ